MAGPLLPRRSLALANYQASDTEKTRNGPPLLGESWQKLKTTRETLESLEAHNAKLQASLQETVETFHKTEADLREQIEKLRLELGALQNAFPLAQADAEGAFLFQNDQFAAIARAEGWQRVQDFPIRIAWDALQEGGLARQEIFPAKKGDIMWCTFCRIGCGEVKSRTW